MYSEDIPGGKCCFCNDIIFTVRSVTK